MYLTPVDSGINRGADSEMSAARENSFVVRPFTSSPSSVPLFVPLPLSRNAVQGVVERAPLASKLEAAFDVGNLDRREATAATKSREEGGEMVSRVLCCARLACLARPEFYARCISPVTSARVHNCTASLANVFSSRVTSAPRGPVKFEKPVGDVFTVQCNAKVNTKADKERRDV